jgi:hypothetical protein
LIFLYAIPAYDKASAGAALNANKESTNGKTNLKKNYSGNAVGNRRQRKAARADRERSAED